MALFPAQSLWPARERAPYLRLGLALVASPLVVAGLFSFGSFLVMGMTEPTGAGVLRETVRSALALSALVFAFTLTFGVAGIAALWAAGRRGVLAWAMTGAVAGAVAGVVFGALAMPGIRQGLVVAFALGGWGIFLLIRRLAGVREAAAG